MEVDDKIKYEKLQYDINKEAAQISSLSSGEIGIYEYPVKKYYRLIKVE